MLRYIDLRSDTITQPTDEMRLAMFQAEVGDDVYGEDETVNKLESLAERMVNKEAALFVASGTMGNQVAIMTHTKRGDEVIAADCSHIIQAEVGAAAALSCVTIRTAGTVDGKLKFSEVENLIRGNNVHFPTTGLICLENATSEGTVHTLEDMKKLHKLASSQGIPVHLDGARVFNAAAALEVEVKDLTRYCESVMFCLSKGLCAPVGSILAGSKEFIGRARKYRKMLGGGLRQAGFLAAAGIVALEKMTARQEVDHRHAKLLAQGLSLIKGVTVELSRVQINMVFANIAQTGRSQSSIIEALLVRGIKANDGRQGDYIRFVTNYWVTENDIEYVLNTMKLLLSEE
ncbi:low specificity L-threonine aldolase [Desulfosporosinus sp. BICA1-9]|uniref:threonine aldolase family protein n=1 Tax=Desulfosporosinus sp. BICA1-9 TaxID=1531958 RepID=UPI00054C2AAF|nr:low specificity L-threonine aldolase [Desulfosporosinus sp. BICA1-9]KJS48588.1 MAG: threonine aldolase [Peptococcaceae bacterium BRH_c23]KJS89743.1 MAG: threonine aldolase [Desulfosporosinus sp. BICA1-9]HBW38138.1 low specificity L-threonine aldolase [Desulfosporosinus sp.]